MSNDLRSDLPALPSRIASLPIARGYPVPWFVPWVDDRGRPTKPGRGTPDFRYMDGQRLQEAMRENRCWVCGKYMLGTTRSFVVGPMCAVNRISAEPPSHEDCATFSARACPFLTRPHATRGSRRDGHTDEDYRGPGQMLGRNPGVALVWTQRAPVEAFREGIGYLFRLDEPLRTRFYAHGRDATREEVLASIESGLPALTALCDGDQEALQELARATEQVRQELVPA